MEHADAGVVDRLVAMWNEKGEITEERLFYNLVGLMKQIGLM